METAEANVESKPMEQSAEFSPSAFGDILKSKAKEAVEETTPAEAPKAEAPPKTEEKPKTEVVESPLAPKEESKVEVQSPKETGLLKAIQSERRKRQELEQQLQALRSQNPQASTSVSPIMDQYMGVQEPTPQANQELQGIAKRFDERFIAMSEHTARQTFKDYTEKEKAFAEAAEVNPQLLDVVIQSDNPGVTLYEIGKRYAFQKKYGTDEEEIRANLKKEMYTEIYSQVENDVLEKFKLRNNQPKDLSSVRAAGGTDTPEFQPAGWKQALRKKGS